MARDGDVEAEWELNHGPTLDPHAAYLWQWWCDIGSTRGSNGFGPSLITRHDIRQWCEDEGHILDPWERRAILALDRIYLASTVETTKAPPKETK